MKWSVRVALVRGVQVAGDDVGPGIGIGMNNFVSGIGINNVGSGIRIGMNDVDQDCT